MDSYLINGKGWVNCPGHDVIMNNTLPDILEAFAPDVPTDKGYVSLALPTCCIRSYTDGRVSPVAIPLMKRRSSNILMNRSRQGSRRICSMIACQLMAVKK